MDNRLQRLINYYEDEHSLILQAIDECLQLDVDYLMAHRLSKVLREITDKLDLFKYLADNLHYQKRNLEEQLKRLEEWLKAETRDFMKPLISRSIDKTTAALEKLNQHQFETEKNNFAFDDTLEKLIRGKIKYFNLVLNKPQNLCLEFRIVKKDFKITIPNIKKLTESFQFFDYQIKEYKRLGFSLTKNGSKMVLLLPCKTADDTQQLKTILSRLVFEVLQFGRNGFKETFIVYKA